MSRRAALQAIVERAASWPENAQQELTQLAGEIEAELTAGSYPASADELRGVDRGLRDAADGKFASEEEVEAVFAKHRGQ